MSTAHGRDNLTRARLALDATGRFLALDVEIVANLGAAMSTGGPGSSTTAPGNAMGGGYAIPGRVHGGARRVHQHRAGGRVSRRRQAGGQLPAGAADRRGGAADRHRPRGAAPAQPGATASRTAPRWRPRSIAAGSPPIIDPALLAADAAGFAARRQAAAAPAAARPGHHLLPRDRPGRAGRGRRDPLPSDGRVSLHLGTQSNGQGHETTFPQIAADRLGLPIECVRLHPGRHAAGPRRARPWRRALAAHGWLGAGGRDRPGAGQGPARWRRACCRPGPDQVRFAAGRFSAGARSVGLLEVARRERGGARQLSLDAAGPHHLPQRLPRGGGGGGSARPGAVRLLRYTAADDFGTAINPLLLVGQVQGGVAQGIGQALMEHTAYDGATGQLLSGSFMDYALPRAADLPDLDVHLHGEPTAVQPAGREGRGAGRRHRSTAGRGGGGAGRGGADGRHPPGHAADAGAGLAGHGGNWDREPMSARNASLAFDAEAIAAGLAAVGRMRVARPGTRAR